MLSDHDSKEWWLPQSQYRTHPDTKFLAQMRFSTLEGEGGGEWCIKTNSKHQAGGAGFLFVCFSVGLGFSGGKGGVCAGVS